MDGRAIPEEYKSKVMSYQQFKDAPILSMKYRNLDWWLQSRHLLFTVHAADIHASKTERFHE